MTPRDLSLFGKEASFGALRIVVRRHFDGRAVAIGWFTKAKLLLGEPETTSHVWTDVHRIVVIIRREVATEGS